jgi:putative transposase
MQSQWGTPQGARALPTRRIDVPKPQRARAKTLAQWMNELPTREAALRAAHVQSGLSMTALAAELGLTVGRVSQLIKRAEGRG